MLPRYRRPLTFGGLLDETFQIYRGAWTHWLAASAVALVPYWAVVVLLGLGVGFGAGAVLSGPRFNPRDLSPATIAALVGAGLTVFVLSWCFLLLWAAALTLLADARVHGENRSVVRAYVLALRRFLPLTWLGVLYLVRILALIVVAIPLFVLGVFGSLGSLVAGIGLLVWWLNAGARRPWLKWLIILATPFGVVMYYAVRWMLTAPVVLLEERAAWGAFGRSATLVQGEWFRTFGVLAVVGIVVSILQALPSGLVTSILIIAQVQSAAPDPTQVPLAANLASNAASLLGEVLFGALSPIAVILLFHDLRNRHEGADLSARVALLEQGNPLVVPAE